ncbi:hypothetical protein HZH68_005163 [Vespula germanica]|uniref:Uncharacterized protein n=2 Tax=Vespula TaxID=7451 RepID=A0A834KJ73_VESGE|nr:hypothetical protein HZH66_004693 [Vespula vulgaris]KAF7405794.1 hypothetical protein HZH68_005163 [Vespula germanica]
MYKGVGYLRSGTWYFDGGQPEVNLRFTRQYRLLLAPPHTAPACSAAMYRDAPAERERGVYRRLLAHNSHNKSPWNN